VLGGLAAGCSGDEQTAEEKAQQTVCSDVDTLEQAVDKVLDDVQDGNFGDAADQISAVEAAFDALVTSVQALGDEKQQTLQTQLNELQRTLGDLTSLESLADIGDALDTAESQLGDLVSTVTDSLSCD
jgi:predicted dinucleotide-utilizing enzyme